jgi:hypothetical protein
MSLPVELEHLREAIAATDRAPYLLTVGDDERPHSVAATWDWQGDELALPVGNRTLTNARARGLISLLWPPSEPSGYSLIVDGDVTHTEGTGAGDNLMRVRPTRAVLHRPAAGPTESPCGADCIPVLRDT